MIDQATIQRIKDTAEIEDVVRSYGVMLKRRGASLWANCPFPGHEEKTPSFCVTPSKRMCKCFGCGKGGDVVNFVKEMEGVGYLDALRILAKKYGIEITEHQQTEEEKQKQEKRESLFAINEFADNWFQNQMWNTPDGQKIAWQYFSNRGIREDVARDFHLGYCPDTFNSFYQAAIQAGYNEQLIEELGLCKKSDKNGKYYDFYRGRVMFPIHTSSGRVIAFGGRILEKSDDRAKYYNSKESDEFYIKSRELYGLFQARASITKKDHCYLCEGYMDVIAMYQNGLTDVVASCGTSLTEEQAKRLSRDTKNITILYDGDKAGIKAAIRAIDLLLPNQVKINVLVLPDDDDPDSFAKKHTTQEYVDYIENNQTNWIDYLLAYKYPEAQNDINRQSETINELVERLALIPDEIYRDICIRTVSERFNISPELLLKQVGKSVKENNEKEWKQQYFKENQTQSYTQTNTQTDNSNQNNVEEQNIYPLDEYAKNILQLLLRYGEQMLFAESSDAVSVKDYIYEGLSIDNIEFENPLLKQIYEDYINGEREFIKHPNPDIQIIAQQLMVDRYPISRFFEYEDPTAEILTLHDRHSNTMDSETEETKSVTKTKMPSDADDLNTLVPRVVLEYKLYYLLRDIQYQQLKQDMQIASDEKKYEEFFRIWRQLEPIEQIIRQLAQYTNKVILN